MPLTQDELVLILLAFLAVNALLIIGALITGRRSRNRAAAAAREVSGSSLAGNGSVPGNPARALASAPARTTGASPTGTPFGPVAGHDQLPPHSAVATPAGGGRDLVTGLADSVAWARLLDDEDPRIRRYRRPVTIVLIELGGLERLTGLLGAEAGDRLLPAVADTIRRLAREADHVARLGPARFGVLLPETNEVAAINYVERVRRACNLWLESGAVSLRLAIGWADSVGDHGLVEVQRLATQRMYDELRSFTRREGDLVDLESGREPSGDAGSAGGGGSHAPEPAT